jgi:hypothetical protein
MTKRKALHIQEDVAESFRELAHATQKDQSDLLRDLMSKDVSYTNTVTINNKMLERIEQKEPIGDFDNEVKKMTKNRGDNE